MTNYNKNITCSPEIMLGKPVIKRTRITVELILKKLSENYSIDELLEAYPDLSKEDILACLSYSAEILSGEEIVAY